VPAVLEMLGIPYSGSDPLTLAATLDKDCAKRLIQSAGGIVPPGSSLNPATRSLASPPAIRCIIPSSSSRPGKVRARAFALAVSCLSLTSWPRRSPLSAAIIVNPCSSRSTSPAMS